MERRSGLHRHGAGGDGRSGKGVTKYPAPAVCRDHRTGPVRRTARPVSTAAAGKTGSARPGGIPADGRTLTDGTVTIRDRDTRKQRRVKKEECAAEIAKRLKG
jgi:hypothetical protein